jgi:hypothetical protein
MSKPHDKVPDWLVERLVAGELPPQAALELRARLKASGAGGDLAEREAGIERSNADILEAHPPALVAAEVRRRLDGVNRSENAARLNGGRRPRGMLVLLPALALSGALAAGAMALVAKPQGTTVTDLMNEAPEVTRMRGLLPSLLIYRKRPAGQDLLTRQSQVRAGDTLQVGYVAAGKRFGVIASVDGRGTVTLHLPERPGQAAALANPGEQHLGHAYELDDSPGFERFVMVTADRPFETAVVTEALRPRGRPLPNNLNITELPLQKSSR